MKYTPWFYNKTFLVDNSKFIKGDIIDIGCGKSKYKKFILSLPQAKSYTGLDFYVAKNVDIVADLNKKIPLEDNKFDTAICISVLEHLLEPQNALNEIYRILKPGGYLLLSTPWIYPYHGEPNDYFRYSKDCLEYLLKKAGFKIISISSTGGKMRIFFVFLINWFPFLKRFSLLIDKLLVFLIKREKIIQKNTPSHHIIAQKVL